MKKHLLMIALQLAAPGADFHYTNRNAHGPHFYEYNALFRPFVSHGTLERAACFGVYAGAAIAGAELLDHFGHNKLALGLRAWQIEESTRGAIVSAKNAQ